jgi:hypothetical protein
MELDDLRSTWDSQNSGAQSQKSVSKIIDQMAQQNYKSRIRRIVYPEMFGSFICLLGAVYIGFNFYRLDTTFLQGVGLVSILLLLILTVNSFLSLKQLSTVADVNRPYADALKIFAVEKLRFYKLQRISITLSYLLLVTVIILFSKFFGDRDITASKYFWAFSFCIGYIFLLLFSSFVSKYYKTTISQTEELLHELKD